MTLIVRLFVHLYLHKRISLALQYPHKSSSVGNRVGCASQLLLCGSGQIGQTPVPTAHFHNGTPLHAYFYGPSDETPCLSSNHLHKFILPPLLFSNSSTCLLPLTGLPYLLRVHSCICTCYRNLSKVQNVFFWLSLHHFLDSSFHFLSMQTSFQFFSFQVSVYILHIQYFLYLYNIIVIIICINSDPFCHKSCVS